MELMETDDPVKGGLLKKASQHRKELQEEVELISERTEKILTNALIVGGALALGYLLVRQFSGSKKSKSKKNKAGELVEEEEEESPSAISSILTDVGSKFATEALTILLSIAKEKLSEYLDSQSQKNKNEYSK